MADVEGVWTFDVDGVAFEMAVWDKGLTGPGNTLGGLAYAAEYNCLHVVSLQITTPVESGLGRGETPILYMSMGRITRDALEASYQPAAHYAPYISQNACKVQNATGTRDRWIIAAYGNTFQFRDGRMVAEELKFFHTNSDAGVSREGTARVVLERASALSEPMLAFVRDLRLRAAPISSDSPLFAEFRTDAEQYGWQSLGRGGAYVRAVHDMDRSTIASLDFMLAEPYVRTMTSDRSRGYFKLFSGNLNASESQWSAFKAWVEDHSNIPAIYVTYLMYFDDYYSACLGDNPRTMRIPWEFVEKWAFDDGTEFVNARSTGIIQHTVPARLYDRLLPFAAKEVPAVSTVDGVLGSLVNNPRRVSTRDAVDSVRSFMRTNACGSDKQVAFERNLFTLYDEHAAANERLAARAFR